MGGLELVGARGGGGGEQEKEYNSQVSGATAEALGLPG
jgi:hypothetical protein